jgi:hypothetical protein
MRDHESGGRRSEGVDVTALHLMMMQRLGSDGQKVCVSVMKRVATEAGLDGDYFVLAAAAAVGRVTWFSRGAPLGDRCRHFPPLFSHATADGFLWCAFGLDAGGGAVLL